MKIAILSPSEKHLKDITAILDSDGHEVVCMEGGKSHLRMVAERDHPDLLIADGLCCDSAELAQAEYVTSHFPSMSVVLMCSSHTPEYLLNAMRAGVREVLPSPVTAEALRATVQRLAAKLVRSDAVPHNGKVLVFLPCKGGSGATFLATNLAWELGQHRKVLLVDLNLQFGDALSFVHDGRAPATLADVADSIDRLDASLLAASTVKVSKTFHLLAAPDDPTEALEVRPDHVEAILALAVRNYDFVVLDAPRRLDPAAVKLLDHAHSVFPVCDASLPAIRHASMLRQVFTSLGYPAEKVRFLLNKWDRNGEIGLDQVRRSLGGAALTLINEAERDVTLSINRGEPLVQTARTHAVAKQIIDLARSLDPHAEEEQTGLFGRIFRRA